VGKVGTGKKKGRAKRIFKVVALTVLALHALFLLVFFIGSVYVRFWNPPVTSLMIYRMVLSGERSRTISLTSLEKMPSSLGRMVLSVEDVRFYDHWGIDPGAMRDAWRRNDGFEKKRYGASTVTQQTARTLFLWPQKSYLRKYLEILIALELDLLVPKERILELYLNYVEWGNGVYGAAAGARHHFGKPLKDLSDDELARLVVLLASPRKYAPDTIGSRPPLRKRYDILREGIAAGMF